MSTNSFPSIALPVCPLVSAIERRMNVGNCYVCFLSSIVKVVMFRFRRLVLVLTTAIAVGVVAPTQAHAASKKAAQQRCDATSGWGALGRPATLNRLGASGFYVWQEKNGTWRISTTHENRKKRAMAGTITFDAPITTKPSGAEGTFDELTSPTQTSVSFSFENFGGIDGISVEARCATQITISGTSEGQPLTNLSYFVGASSSSPKTAPLILARTSPNPSAVPMPAQNVEFPEVTTTVPASTTTIAGSPSPASSSVSTAAPAVGVAAPIAGSCPVGNWPISMAGRPKALKAGKAAPGMYLWTETNLVKVLFVADATSPVTYSGRISADAPIAVAPVGLDGGDSVKADGLVVTFSLKTSSALDGFNMNAPCATRFTVEVDAGDAPPVTLFLGVNSTPVPAANAFLFR
jgi:hypothetical protein